VATSPDTTAIALVDSNGALLFSTTLTIPANGAIQRRVADLFATSNVPAQGAYIFAAGQAATSSLAATSVTRRFLVPEDSVVINGLISISTTLRVPYFVEGTAGGSRYRTMLGIVNIGTDPTSLTLTLNIPNRTPITVQRSLGATASLQASVSEIFGVSEAIGWIEISSAQPITAWIAYADTANGGASIVPADTSTAASSPLIFSHIADLNPWWTGIALLNSASVAANVEIFAFDPAGTIIDGPGTSPLARFTLAAGNNRAFLLGEVLPRTQTRTSDGGYVVVRSTNGVPLSGLELFFLRNGRVFANVPGSLSAAFTHPDIPSLSTVIDLVRVSTTDTAGVEKTSFTQGDPVILKAERSNALAFQVTAQSRYVVRGPSGTIFDSFGSSTAPSGNHTRTIGLTIQTTAPPGTYTFEGTVSYNGASVTKSSTFTVVALPKGSPDVEVTRAFTINESGAEATTFATNQPIGFVMERNNRLTTQVTVQARYRAIGPSQYSLFDQTVSSAAPPGPHFRFLDTTIPSTAPNGTYTFEGSVTYNGVTSTKSSTFTVTGGAGFGISDIGRERIILSEVSERLHAFVDGADLHERERK
jgi:hypothetical protein